MYFNGLDREDGYLYDSGMKVAFSGTVYNENIVFVGLNLPYHYFLTQDQNVGEYMNRIMGDDLSGLPERTIVPLQITYSAHVIRIRSPRDGVNTSLAYHDIFQSRQKIDQEHTLTVVRHGVTVIRLHYPYLPQGLCMSLVGIFGYIWSCHNLLRKRGGRKKMSVERSTANTGTAS